MSVASNIANRPRLIYYVVDTASILGLLYGRSIDAWRQKELASEGGAEPEDGPATSKETFNLRLTGKSCVNKYTFILTDMP